jgi:hypothetical protein
MVIPLFMAWREFQGPGGKKEGRWGQMEGQNLEFCSCPVFKERRLLNETLTSQMLLSSAANDSRSLFFNKQMQSYN